MVAEQSYLTEHAHLIGLVDDDQRVLDGMQELLESVGYGVLPFRSAKSLLISEDLNSIACVITDIGMPEVNGIELREILSREHPKLPVILITGRYELIENISPASDFLILRKPFDISALLSTLSDCISGI
ncbi:response regulator transcription factor [Agrobacterium tumefaciens]|uniref:response regulator transcription factor n=1 Tax=Agrobacterium tumefaciens TaxID=358 RepID=UPI003BA110A8